MDLNAVLIKLRSNNWRVKMSTSSSDECAFAFTAHRSGVGIGPNGIYGYGTTPASAMYNLVTNIEEFLKELAKQKAKEEEDAIRGENE